MKIGGTRLCFQSSLDDEELKFIDNLNKEL